MNGHNGVRPWKRQGKQNTRNYCNGFGSMRKMDQVKWCKQGGGTRKIFFQNANKIFTENLIQNCSIDADNKPSSFLVHMLTVPYISPSKLLFSWYKALNMLKYQHLPLSSPSSQTLHLLRSLFSQRDHGTIFWGTHSQESQRNPVFSHNAGT